MRVHPSRRVATFATAALLALLASACTDSRVRELTLGISKDSVFKIIGQGAPAGDSLPNVYKRVQYFVDSKFFDIFLFDPQNRKVWEEPNVLDKELTPIVVIQDKLEGTGWGYADELAGKYKFQIRSTKAATK
ncbi:MAG: hypothetical protein IT359_07610 [Gemmatimonadaceae bacterium]|nr:hypothetical protein [Gemmatimonadaceae bacterium]